MCNLGSPNISMCHCLNSKQHYPHQTMRESPRPGCRAGAGRLPQGWLFEGAVRFEGVRLRYARYSHTRVGGAAPAAGGTAGGPAASPAEGGAGRAGSGAGAAAPVEGSAGSAAEGAAWDPPADPTEGAWALAGLDLELHPGERLGLVGRTGAPFGTRNLFSNTLFRPLPCKLPCSQVHLEECLVGHCDAARTLLLQ